MPDVPATRHELPLPCRWVQGIAALMAMNMVEVAAGGSGEVAPWQSAQRLHPMIEAMRLAFADAFAYNGDPDVVPVPVQQLLAKEYAAQRWQQCYAPDAASPVAAGAPHEAQGGGPAAPISSEEQDTVFFCAVDKDGNGCSFINSNYQGFGTGIVPPGCGFSLQNRGSNFILDPGHPNCLAGGKRPYHTIIPALATHEDSGDLFAVFGVMGGFMQPQGHLQVLSNMVDYGHDPQTALDAPRFLITAVDSNAGPSCVATSRVLLEDGISEEVARELQGMGHQVQRSGPSWTFQDRDMFGKGQIIRRDPATGVLWGGSDPRGDGLVISF